MTALNQVGRIFSDDKTIDSRALNLAGVQPLRTILARLVYRLRRGSSDPMVSSLVRTGILVYEDFLPSSLFDAVRAEASDYMASESPTWLTHDGTTEVRQFSLATVAGEDFQHLASWRTDSRVFDLASAAERRNCRHSSNSDGSLVEELKIGDYAEPDSQTILHLDTFFNTHKVWVYLDDVEIENAPFVYVPGSHLLDSVRLGYDYRESTGANEKSRRVTDEEIRKRGLERRVVTCRRNTLVIANTCGYHCRSLGESGATRRALHMTFRANPFSADKWNRAQFKRSAAGWVRRVRSG